VIHGCLIVKDAELAARLRFLQNASGAVPAPMDCFLVLRGIKTLHLRVQRACENAEAIAHFLKSHPKMAKIYWPGFPDHPNHDIAHHQIRLFRAMVSFDLHENTYEAAEKILSGTELFTLAESLGGVESLIGHPASMTHASIPREARLKVGLTDSLVRLSIGVEDADDLIADLKATLG
jgi:cystathionine beta-lyase